MNKTFIGKWLLEISLLVAGWVSILAFENPFAKVLQAVYWWSLAYLFIVAFMVEQEHKNSVKWWGS